MEPKFDPYGSSNDKDDKRAEGRGGEGDRDPKPGAREDVDVAAQLMVGSLESLGYHPVILCGTNGSGKTTAMASLCSFFLLRGGSIEFGKWPSDGGSTEHAERFAQARQFYDKVVNDFTNGIAPKATGAGWPYIVPLEITPTTQPATMPVGPTDIPRPIRVAFVDMTGELYKPRSADDRGGHKLNEVQQLLTLFPRGVSMIYFAPTTRIEGYNLGSGDSAEPHKTTDEEHRVREDPDLALINALSAYVEARPVRKHDRHLFVLSKWDLACNVEDPGFTEPDPMYVQREYLDKDFPSAWGKFKTMHASPRSKWWLQYSAGLINGRTRRRDAAESPVGLALDLYAKVVWNWIYRGATRGDDFPEGLVLFPELQPPQPKRWFSSPFWGR